MSKGLRLVSSWGGRGRMRKVVSLGIQLGPLESEGSDWGRENDRKSRLVE